MFLPLILILFSTNSVLNSKENKEKVDYFSQNNFKLLIVLLDGFRWDYISRDKHLKGFPRIAENGVQAQYVKPIFPANSYPNWYAISTGLYAESHGIIDNYMYDQTRDQFFLQSPNPNASLSHWWNQTKPLWVNAEKQGVKTSMYLWDGCQVSISGIKASLCHKYIGIYDPIEANHKTRSYVNNILNDFTQNKYRLSMLYYELVDHFGHNSGPNSENVMQAVRQIDAILYDLYNEIIDRKLDKTLNVIIVSDHGMTDWKGFKKVFLNQSIDFNDIDLMLDWDSGAQIITKPGKENKGRVMQGKVVPTPNNDDDGKPLIGGNHGYDTELTDMRAIMYGFGPAFKRNFKSNALEMVDHYNLFCHILGITGHPNNGTYAKVKPFLVNE